MKLLGIIAALFLGWSSFAEAKIEGFALQYTKPLVIRIFSMDTKGVTQEEYFQCTPQTCCFSERFYCFMANGQCICPLHLCQEWPDSSVNKTHWMVISGTDAERVCRPGKIHDVTDLCFCDPNKESPCDECNRPMDNGFMSPNAGDCFSSNCGCY